MHMQGRQREYLKRQAKEQTLLKLQIQSYHDKYENHFIGDHANLMNKDCKCEIYQDKDIDSENHMPIKSQPKIQS